MADDITNIVLGPIIEKMITPVVDNIVRQLGYLLYYKSNIKSLEDKADQLESTRKDVDDFFEAQKQNNIETAASSARWLREVEKVIKEAKDVDINTSKLKGCQNLKGRYVMGRKSTKLAVEIQKLQKEAPKDISTNTVVPAGRLRGAAANHYSRGYQTRVETVEEIMKALEDDEISVIGICGLGGVGKTTIVHEVREMAMEQKLFKESAMAIVSQNQELLSQNQEPVSQKTQVLFKIQDDLAEMLGLTKLKEKENVIERADQLYKRLTNGTKVLVIFDDVWSDLNMKDIGVPDGSEQTGCKVIITSRVERVCSKTQKSITVQVLAKEEARALFRQTAGEHVQKNNLEEIADSVADECGGLPIALLTLSRALSNKDRRAWEDTLTQLREGNLTSIHGMDEKVFKSIKLSYDFLATENKKEAQWLLLICCQHQEDACIEVEKLAQYCMSLDLFEGVTSLLRARNRVSSLLGHLKSRFLLQAVVANYGSEEWGNEVVKVHDLVRDVCGSIMSRVKEERDRVYMHIMDEKIDRGNKMDTGEVEYPKVKILLNASLFRGNLAERLLLGMEDLRVLETCPGLDFKRITPHSGFQFSPNLRMLCLGNVYIGEVAMKELTRLTKLEILSFYCSKVDSLPSEIGNLSNLKLLDLRCYYDEDRPSIIPLPKGILPGLVKLEVLYMGNHHFGDKSYNSYDEVSKGEAEKRISELDSLLNLTTLQTVVLNLMALKYLKRLRFEKLENFYFASVGGWYKYRYLSSWKTIELKDIGINWVLEDKMQSLVRRTVHLLLKDIKDFTDPKIMDQFESLRSLKMINCNELIYIVGDGIDNASHSARGPSSSRSTGGGFKNLESLKMKKMSNVKELCRGKLPEGTLCKLKELNLRELPDIRYLWMGATNSMCLVNLTKVKIVDCSSLEFIFPHSASNCLKELQYLIIKNCESLKGIVCKDEGKQTTGGRGRGRGRGRGNVQDPSVPKDVHIFKNLRTLKVERCGGLTYLIPYSVAHMLVNLQELAVERCKGIKVVICDMNEEEFGEMEKKILFLSLRTLVLTDMENLSSFCSNNQLMLEFPALASVSIHECPKIETLYQPRVASSRMLEKNMFKGGGKTTGGGEIIKVPSDLVVHFPKLNYISLKHTPKLRGFNNIDKATGRLLTLFNSWEGAISSTVEDIEVDGLNMVKQIVVGGTMRDFNEFVDCDWLQNLGALELRLCDSLDSLFDLEQQDFVSENSQVMTLPKLKILKLISLSSLTCMFRCQMKDISIPELQAVYVEECGSLVNVAASNLIKQLWNLRELTLNSCSSMTSVFDFEELDVMRENVASVLGALEKITLYGLPKLEHVCRSFTKEIHVFQHLKTLNVYNCGSMAYLIPSPMVHMLMNLQELIVQSCENMKEVVCKDNEENGSGELEKKIVFHSLKSVQLRDLKNLSSFCSSDQLVLEFPALESVSIDDCRQIETFYCQKPRVARSGMLEKNMSTTGGAEIMEVPSDLEEVQFPKPNYIFFNGTLRGFNNIDKSTRKLLPLYDSWDMPSTMKEKKVDGLNMEKQIVGGGTILNFERQDVMCENAQVMMLPKLKILELDFLSNLTCIFRCQMKVISFPELQAIRVKYCSSLVNVAASDSIKQLWNLKEITLNSCSSMTSVFDFEGLDVMREDVPSILGALEDITLWRLPKVKYLCRSIPKEIHGFQHLKTLKVEDCGSMAYLIPSSMVHMLMNLQELIIKSCENMKEVVCKINEDDDCGELKKKIVFRSLRRVELGNLKNLSSFCSSDQLLLEFPVLEGVYIHECPQMETFCCGLPRTDCSGLLEEIMSKGKEITTEGEINKVPSEILAQFPKMESVYLPGTPNRQGFFYSGYNRINQMKSDLKENGVIDVDADHAAMEEDENAVHASTEEDVDESAQDLTARVTQFSSHVRENDVVDLSADTVDDIQVFEEGVSNEYDQCGSEALDNSGTSSSTPFDQAFPDGSLAPVVVSPLPPVSDNNKDQAYSSISDLKSVNVPVLIETIPSLLSEQSVPGADNLSGVSSKVDTNKGKTITLQNEVRESISSIEPNAAAALKALDLKVEDMAKEMKEIKSGVNLKLEEMKSDVNLKLDAILEAIKASRNAPAASSFVAPSADKH